MDKTLLKAMARGFLDAILAKNHDVVDIFIAGLGSTTVYMWLTGIGPIGYFLFYLTLVFGKAYFDYRQTSKKIEEAFKEFYDV